MEQRPDSPIANKPDASAPQQAEQEQVSHHVSSRKKRKKGVGGEEMELQLTSMIDVIFQLLIYFVITANFMIDEGTIIATLPGNAADSEMPMIDMPPYLIVLTADTEDDGRTYDLVAGRTRLNSISELTAHLEQRVADREMSREDPVQLQPDATIRWQHVVNAYNACINAEMENINLAP